MSGLSRATWTLLQQLTSDDLMTGDRLLARDTLEIARYLAGDRTVVLGGLMVRGTAQGVTVAPGVVLAPYASGPGAPRPEESPFVVGRLGAATAVALEVPEADRWQLVQARPREVEAYGPRMVWDEGAAQLMVRNDAIVRREQLLELGAKVGSSSEVPAPDAGWVPLAAVLRRASGTVPTAAEILDLRPGVLEAPATEARFETHDFATINAPGPGAQLRCAIECVDPLGRRLSAHGTFATLSLLAQAYVPAGQSWSYLYLCPWRGLVPRTATGRGVLILSEIAPSVQGGRSNSGPISLPAPWASSVPAGEAVCVGVLRTHLAGGDSFIDQVCTRGRWSVYFGSIGTALGVLSASARPPRNARTLSVTVQPAGGGSGTDEYRLRAPSTGPILSQAFRMADKSVQTLVEIPDLNLTGIDVSDIQLSGPSITIACLTGLTF